jgi:ankyrin repeat protein
VANDRGQTPLAGAAFKGDVDMIRLLLDHGARADGAMADGKTAFMMAAMFNRLEVMQLLVDRGADPHSRDAAGMSAIDIAEKTRAVDAVEWLRRAARPADQAGSPTSARQ